MAALLEPPRARPRPADPERYPGLTLEERGLDPSPTVSPAIELEPPPPLWIAPSEIPPESRSLGFAAAYPDDSETIVPDPPRPEGLFDVPGLLERLWLARALEAARDRAPPSSALAAARVEPVTPVIPWTGPPTRYGLSGGQQAVSPAAPPPSPPRSAPKGWICPRCYLTNNVGAAECRGCQRPNPGP